MYIVYYDFVFVGLYSYYSSVVIVRSGLLNVWDLENIISKTIKIRKPITLVGYWKNSNCESFAEIPVRCNFVPYSAIYVFLALNCCKIPILEFSKKYIDVISILRMQKITIFKNCIVVLNSKAPK